MTHKMVMKTEALVTPQLLSWARKRRGMTTSEIAAKMNVPSDVVVAWEAGDKRPTFAQAQAFAKKLHIPFGYLYLHESPIERMPLVDFRTTRGGISEPSPDLLDLLTDVLGKQQWLRDYRRFEGYVHPPFAGRFGITDSEDVIAEDMRDILDAEDARKYAHSMDDFLEYLVQNTEESGIAVMRSGVVRGNNHRPLDRAEFRGFSIHDNIVPLVFINTCDFKWAQIFTLVHEIAHIWIGKGGVSNPDYELQYSLQEKPVELLCNRVAVETLVPRGDLLSYWKTKDVLEENLDGLRKRYKVSDMIILRQALNNNLIDISEYRMRYAQLVKLTRSVESDTDDVNNSGGDFDSALITRNGKMFTEAVINSTVHEDVLWSEAADMLDVKVKEISGIMTYLYGS
ncbi:MAG: ImmA/IrrE family metallo-endopeptidase [Cenarchaeum sp. SB0665_bin_23]|nr:ImmA/IrrE family metallo-endopeptidase [Cenarchaeum sp. SB0665_bin_23]MYG33347.1 ImmA/IrrE family metallo-endopeptidase [Cenarchaeum sp. SB0677_bin_16]